MIPPGRNPGGTSVCTVLRKCYFKGILFANFILNFKMTTAVNPHWFAVWSLSPSNTRRPVTVVWRICLLLGLCFVISSGSLSLSVILSNTLPLSTVPLPALPTVFLFCKAVSLTYEVKKLDLLDFDLWTPCNRLFRTKLSVCFHVFISSENETIAFLFLDFRRDLF